jgi:hypothetical protein
MRARLAVAVARGRAEAAVGFRVALPDQRTNPDLWVVPECVDEDVAAAVSRRGIGPFVLARPCVPEAQPRLLDLWFERRPSTWHEETGRSALGGRRAPDQCRIYHQRIPCEQHLARYSHEADGSVAGRMDLPAASRAGLAYWAQHERIANIAVPTLRAARMLIARAPMPPGRARIVGAPPDRRWLIFCAEPASPDERRWLASRPDPAEW